MALREILGFKNPIEKGEQKTFSYNTRVGTQELTLSFSLNMHREKELVMFLNMLSEGMADVTKEIETRYPHLVKKTAGAGAAKKS